MALTIVKLLDGATSTVTGKPVKMPTKRVHGAGSIPFVLSGITVANVVLEATIATQREVDEGTAQWEQIQSASWSADIADGIFTAFSHIRARVSAYTSGTITLTIFV